MSDNNDSDIDNNSDDDDEHKRMFTHLLYVLATPCDPHQTH